MKKHLLILACACFAFAACDGLTPDGNGDGNGTENGGVPGLDQLPDIGGGNKPTAELTPAQQQAKFQSVGQDLLKEFPATEFENLAKIAEAFDKTYGYNDRYDLSDLEEWMETAGNLIYSDTENESSNGDNYHHFGTTNFVLVLANHTGLFTFGANKVTVDKSYTAGTKAVFMVEGKTYEAELTSRGKTTTAYLKYEYHSENGWESSYNKYENTYDQVSQITISVPEQLNVALTENGKPLATITFKFDAKVTPEHIQPSTDALATEITAVINGYELKISKTGYDGQSSKAQMLATISRNGNTLVTYAASADLHMTYEEVSGGYINEDEWSKDYGSWSATEIVVKKADNINIAMDILGQIQVTGTCSNALKAIEEMDKVYDALSGWDNENQQSKPADLAAAYRHTEEMNKYLDFGVYYDKGNNKQADLKFEYFYEEHNDEWGSWYNWGFHPIIVFHDGSQNKVEDFFTEQAFSKLIDSVEEFAESYETVFGYFL